MARYAPLPPVSIDPRNEAALVQRAAQVAYEASNGTLNDFSAGNPLAALLEGQAFAQGEFLFWANQLPEKILIEWIGPFLGAMRRVGTPSSAELTVTVPPRNVSTLFPSGSVFSTNSQLTGGESYEFVSSQDLTIPAGGTTGKLLVYSRYVGSSYNVAANTITVSSTSNVPESSVTNLLPAVGGSDVETYEEVKERFFSLIRRRNPVSESDWQDFFTNLYGQGTLTTVQPNRSSRYGSASSVSNGQVSFFVLGPNGVELTETQLESGQTAINYSVPIGTQGHLYPITLTGVQYNISLEIESNGVWGKNFREASLNFRDRLFSIFQPGSVFPATLDPSPGDVDSAFYSTFDTNYRYTNPHIVSSQAYNTPNFLTKECATYTRVLEFAPKDFLLNLRDLVRKDDPNPTFYPVEISFTPYSSDKFDQTLYGNLSLKQIQNLGSGSYKTGEVVYYDGGLDPAEEGLHVILDNVTVNSPGDVISLIDSGKISELKDYSPWVVGNTYANTVSGFLNPEIIQYDYSEGEFIPASPAEVSLEKRPGSLVWLVSKNFVLQSSTNDIEGANVASNLGDPVEPLVLNPDMTYTVGSWVYTPQIGSGPDEVLDPNYFYVDVTKGGVVKYAYVLSTFVYNPDSSSVSEYFESLKEQGIIQEITVFDGNEGLPVYQYKPRFQAGQYLEYRRDVSSNPEYFIASEYFTPRSTDPALVPEIINVTPTEELYNQFNTNLSESFSGQIGSLRTVGSGFTFVNGTYINVPLSGGDGIGGTANVFVSGGVVTDIQPNNRGQKYRYLDNLTISGVDLGNSDQDLAVEVTSINPVSDNPIYQPVRMFTFFKGDRTLFRGGGRTQVYLANEAVTPLFDFEVYYKNNVFTEDNTPKTTGEAERYIPFFNPAYANYAEDTIEDRGGRDLYRVMKGFTPTQEVTNWSNTGTQVNSPRYQEFSGNLLRYVSSYSCDEPILPQYDGDTSSIKLGPTSVTLIPKNSSRQTSLPSSEQKVVYVWENTESASSTPELSWFTGTTSVLSPPDYGIGTLSL